MPRANSNGLQLEYDTFGDPGDPPLMLVMGLGTQMIGWPAAFCEQIAGHGFHVVRMDNRDIGLSTYLDELGEPDLEAILTGDTSSMPYVLADFAEDLLGLLDALGFAAAHLVGASMGGMIIQQFAIDHPGRMLSLCSIMSTTGDPTVGQPAPELMVLFTQTPATEREAAIEQGIATIRMINSPGYPGTEEQFRREATEAYERAYHPAGTVRQTAAVIGSPARTEGLRTVEVPTLIIHGDADPLVDVSGGRATAAAIPEAKLLIIPGMAHDLPEALWPQLVDAIVANAKSA